VGSARLLDVTRIHEPANNDGRFLCLKFGMLALITSFLKADVATFGAVLELLQIVAQNMPAVVSLATKPFFS
jgi:hypothetical protein